MNSGQFKPGQGNISFSERYERLAFPEPNTGCFIWMGGLNEDGYGRVWANNKMSRAHRVAYEYFIGPVPKGKVLDHKCRMRCCVNPDHLEPVFQGENIRRGFAGEVVRARHAAQTRCKQGHLLSGENLVPSTRGRRVCRVCQRRRQSDKKYHENRRRG